jgi:hypothetical protein
MQLAPHLQPVLAALQRAYPRGLPERDYSALLVVLQSLLSEENLAAVVAELVDGERVAAANDAAAASSISPPNPQDVKRIRARLEENGLAPEEG